MPQTLYVLDSRLLDERDTTAPVLQKVIDQLKVNGWKFERAIFLLDTATCCPLLIPPKVLSFGTNAAATSRDSRERFRASSPSVHWQRSLCLEACGFMSVEHPLVSINGKAGPTPNFQKMFIYWQEFLTLVCGCLWRSYFSVSATRNNTATLNCDKQHSFQNFEHLLFNC